MDLYTFIFAIFVVIIASVLFLLILRHGKFFINKIKVAGTEFEFQADNRPTHPAETSNHDDLQRIVLNLQNQLEQFNKFNKSLEEITLKYESTKKVSVRLQNKLDEYKLKIDELNLELSVYKNEGVEGVSIIEDILYDIEEIIRNDIKECCLRNHFLQIKDYDAYIRDKIHHYSELLKEYIVSNKNNFAQILEYSPTTASKLLNKSFIDELYYPTQEVFFSFRNIIKVVSSSSEFLKAREELSNLLKNIQADYYKYLLMKLNSKKQDENNRAFITDLMKDGRLKDILNSYASLKSNLTDSQKYGILNKQLDEATILLSYFRKYFEKVLKELLLEYIKNKKENT